MERVDGDRGASQERQVARVDGGQGGGSGFPCSRVCVRG